MTRRLASWSATGNLGVSRLNHVAVRLPNGKVLAAGGQSGAITWNGAELYDPDIGVWSPTGNLTIARTFATATLLANGKVLVAGGSGVGGALNTAELYDPASGAWSSTGTMNTARTDHTATLLAGGRVLVASGDSGPTALHFSAELYDPANGSWTPTGSLWHGGPSIKPRCSRTAECWLSVAVTIPPSFTKQPNFTIRPRDNGARPAA